MYLFLTGVLVVWLCESMTNADFSINKISICETWPF